EINFALIFSTAYDKYAVRAFKASALDFLLKPVGKDDLSEALSKVRARLKKESPVKQLEVLYENIKYHSNNLKKIIIPTINGFDYVNVEKIIRLESESNYTTFHFNDKTKLMVARTLKDFEELLTGQHFFRCHHSHLINLRYMKKYIRGEGGVAVMEDGKEVDISRRRKEEFLKALQEI
ncbi:MAG: LytTR family DNA-binding domain-containing protein, partial [Bacteroidota bacterium]